MSSVTHSARRLNSLALELGSATYLEIGVEKGATFFDVKVKQKTAVDPEFRFDPSFYGGDNNQFISKASDQFFVESGASRVYDLVFLDGLHTYEQTLRDFLAVLTMTHAKSVIVIDDVLPSDVFSSLRDHGAAIRFRERHGGSGPAWHGDVFKVIAFIHDFLPNISYKTIDGVDNAQTIIWRRPRGDFRPKFNSTERISRLDYFDLMNNIDMLKLEKEESVLKTVLADLKS